MPLAIARMCRAVCQRLPSFLLSSYNTLCTYTNNNNNNTSICKAHNVSIKAESEAPNCVRKRGPRQNNILETTLTNSSEYINDLV